MRGAGNCQRNLSLAPHANGLRYHRVTPPSPRPSALHYMMKRLHLHFAIVAGFRALAIALTVFLFVVGSFPAAGQAFPGVTHWIAHLAACAVIAFTLWSGLAKATGHTRCRFCSRAGRNSRIL